VILDELTHDARPAQHLGQCQDEIGGGDAFAQAAVQCTPTTSGSRKYTGWPEHARLGLDAAHAPADDAEAVDHRGVRVGAEDGVREADAVALRDRGREVLEVHLMTDADPRRHDVEAVERVHAPAQETVASFVARELELHVAAQCVAGGETHRPAPNGR
jgi:hypothetical protein